MRILVSSSAVDLEPGGWIPSFARKVQLPCRWQVPTHFPSRNHCLTTSDDIKTSGRSGREGLKKPSISERLQWDFLHDTPHVMSSFLGKLEKQHQLLWYSILRQTQFGDQKKCLLQLIAKSLANVASGHAQFFVGPLTRWTELRVRDVRCRGNFASDYYLTWSISKSSRLSRLGTWPFRLLSDYLTHQKFTLTKQVS